MRGHFYFDWAYLTKQTSFLCGRCTQRIQICCSSSQIVLIFKLFIGESPRCVLKRHLIPPNEAGRVCVSSCVICQQTHWESKQTASCPVSDFSSWVTWLKASVSDCKIGNFCMLQQTLEPFRHAHLRPLRRTDRRKCRKTFFCENSSVRFQCDRWCDWIIVTLSLILQ